MTKSIAPTAPLTQAPTDTEWANHARWAVGPVGTRRQLWVENEAQAIARADGRPWIWPTTADYAAANVTIPVG